MKKLFSFFWLCSLLLPAMVACNQFDDDVVPEGFAGQLSLKDDIFTTAKDQPVLLDVLANDNISGNGSLTFRAPVNGTISPESEGFIYTPALNFTGTDSFYYRFCLTGTSTCDSAQVTINVVN